MRRRKCGESGQTTKAGQPCGNYAVEGGTTCRAHAGRPPGRTVRPGVKTGEYSAHMKSLSAEGRARLSMLEKDPELLEVRKPVALSALLLESAPLEPDPELVWIKAAEIQARRLGRPIDELEDGELPGVPDAVDVWRAWMELIDPAHKRVLHHASAVNAAYAKSRKGELLMAGAAPFMARLADLLRGVLERQLRDDPERLSRVMTEIQTVFAAVAAQIAAAGD